MHELTEFQQRAAAAALEKLLSAKYFDICTLRQIASLTGQNLYGKDAEALAALHCVDYAVMGPELHRQVQEKCLELLGLPPRIIDIQPSAPAAKRSASILSLAWWK